jgi:hypothetical protein
LRAFVVHKSLQVAASVSAAQTKSQMPSYRTFGFIMHISGGFLLNAWSTMHHFFAALSLHIVAAAALACAYF